MRKRNVGFTSSVSGAPLRKENVYFCTHCKINGHSVDRCFKLHGYPPNFKGPKDIKVNVVVSTTTMDSGDNTSTVSSATSPMIFVAQYQQLMELLNKQSVFNSQVVAHQTDHAWLVKFVFQQRMFLKQVARWIVVL